MLKTSLILVSWCLCLLQFLLHLLRETFIFWWSWLPLGLWYKLLVQIEVLHHRVWINYVISLLLQDHHSIINILLNGGSYRPQKNIVFIGDSAHTRHCWRLNHQWEQSSHLRVYGYAQICAEWFLCKIHCAFTHLPVDQLSSTQTSSGGADPASRISLL